MSLLLVTSAQSMERQQRRTGAAEVLLGKVRLLQEPAFEVLLAMLVLWRTVLEAEELLEKMLLLWRPGLDGQEVELREWGHSVLAARRLARTAVRCAPIPKTGEEPMPASLTTLQTNQHQAMDA